MWHRLFSINYKGRVWVFETTGIAFPDLPRYRLRAPSGLHIHVTSWRDTRDALLEGHVIDPAERSNQHAGSSPKTNSRRPAAA